MKNKKGTAFYLNLSALILGIVGVVLAIYSSMMTVENALTNLPLVIAAGVASLVLVAGAVLLPSRLGENSPSSWSALWAALHCTAMCMASASCSVS